MAMEKVSLSLPADLLAEARKHAKNGNLSAYVADGLRLRLRAEYLDRYLEELDEEFGPISEEDIEAARRLWHE